jgi:hypothetical protein
MRAYILQNAAYKLFDAVVLLTSTSVTSDSFSSILSLNKCIYWLKKAFTVDKAEYFLSFSDVTLL